jgi:hypothetical protein
MEKKTGVWYILMMNLQSQHGWLMARQAMFTMKSWVEDDTVWGFACAW